jgi:fibronectin type 3 domain-containing protein
MKIRTITLLALLMLLVLPQTSYGSGQQLFQPYINYPTGSRPEAVAIGDVNGDGKNDVVMTTSSKADPLNDYKIFVFLQNSTGGLNSPIKYPVSGSYTNRPQSVDIADLNNDGKKDVVVGNDRKNIEVFIQNQSGGLNPGVAYATTNSTSIKTGDFNHDGLMDVAGIGWGSNSADVLLQKSDGTLGTPTTYSVPHGGYDELEAGDVNNDGLTDLIVMSGQGYTPPNVSILYQQSNGFSLLSSYRVGVNQLTHGVAVGDINNDKLNDVIVSYGGNSPSSFIGTFNQNSQGTLNPVVNYAAYDCPGPVGVADVNSDGRMDIIALNGGWNALSLYLQDTNGNMMPYSLYQLPYASSYNPQGLAIGDINSDGYPDIAIADYNNGLVILNHSNPAAVPAASVNLTGNSPTSGEIDLNWDASFGATSYNVYRSNTQYGTYTKVGSPTANSFKDTGLLGSTTYWYKVSAVNAAGESAQTGPVSVTVSPDPLTAPSGLTATGVSRDQVYLEWNAVTGAAKYTVYVATSQYGTYSLLGSVTGNTGYAYGLSANTTYWFKVSAANSVAEGPISTAVSGKTLAASGKAAPSGLTATAVSRSQINLNWTAVAGTTKYIIYVAASQSGPYFVYDTSTTTTYSDAGLNPNTTWWYKVSAVDSMGEGLLSTIASGTTLASSTIAAPTGLTATAVSKSQINLKWTAVTGATKYNIYRAISQYGTYSYVGTSTTNTYYNPWLSANTTYWYKVSAVNSTGEGLQSTVVSGKTLASSTIAAPTGLQATAVSKSQINLNWTAVTGATKYNIYRAISQYGTYSYVGTSTTNTYYNAWLGANTTYWYKVSAVNSTGEGSQSTGISGKTLASSTIAAPTGLQATAVSKSQINLKWTAVTGATKYIISRSTSQTGTYSYVGSTTANNYANIWLSANTTYWYKVSAVNSIGEGLQSTVVSGKTLASSTIVAPTGLQSTAVSKSQINLKWTAVTGATKYLIYRATSQTGTYICVGSTTANNYANIWLSANTTYWYKVSAVNSTGEGLQSTGISGKTLASSTIAAPIGLTATGVSKSQINLKWTAVTGATKYNIYRATSQTGTYICVGTSTTNTYYNAGLGANITYWYKVSAVDSTGEGLQSTEISAKTLLY